MADEKPIDEITYIAPGTAFRLEGHRLRLRAGEAWTPVTLAPLFPLSEPECWIAVLDADGKEVGILTDLHGLDHAGAAAVREELRRRDLVPRLEKITSARDRFGMTEFAVESDRGPLTIVVRHPQENIQQPLPGYFTLIDVDNNRFDIPDITRLDPESRRMLEERL
jgi:hypothetical protein